MVKNSKKIYLPVIFFLAALLLPIQAQEELSNEQTDEQSVKPLENFRGKTVVDLVGKLTSEEAGLITAELEVFSANANTDAVIVIVESTGEKTLEAYADDYFDYNGYGKEDEGILLLIVTGDGSTGNRKAHISTSGSSTIKTITDKKIDMLLDALIDGGLKNNHYKKGVTAYIEALEGIYFNTLSKGELIVSLIIGLIAYAMTYSFIKSAYKLSHASPLYDEAANVSCAFASFDDPLIDTHTFSTKRKSSDNKKGNSTHKSSSGKTHGGGGRSF